MGRSSAKADRGATVRARPERPYGGAPPDERRKQRRERLLGAALELFGTQGYAKTTIERLCLFAAVATRHFYEEFDGREALLKAVYDETVSLTYDAALAALAKAGEEPKARIRASLQAFLDAYLTDPRRGRIACIEIVGVSSELESHRRQVIHTFAKLIAAEAERSARSGHQPMRDFSLIGIALAGAVNELVIECFTRTPPPKRTEVRDELLGLFVAGMQGASTAFEYLEECRREEGEQ